MGVGTIGTEFNTTCGSIATVICPRSTRRSRYFACMQMAALTVRPRREQPDVIIPNSLHIE